MKFIKFTKDLSKVIDDKRSKKIFHNIKIYHHIILHCNILYYMIILCLIINVTKEDIPNSIIILRINGTGNQTILSDASGHNFSGHIPDDILINGVSQDIKGKIVYNLNRQINNITIIWIV